MHGQPFLVCLSIRKQLQAIAYHHLLCDSMWGRNSRHTHTPLMSLHCSNRQRCLCVGQRIGTINQNQAPEIRACCVNNASMQPSQLLT